MKKQIIPTVALLLLLLTNFSIPVNATSSPAGQKLDVQLKKGAQDLTLEVHLANLGRKRTGISLQEPGGRTWLSIFLWKEESAKKALNLSGMPVGNYILKVENQDGQFLQTFVLHDGNIVLFENRNLEGEGKRVFSGGKQKCSVITRIQKEDERSVTVQLANLNKAPASVSILAIGKGPVLELPIENEHAFAKKFNFEGMAPGSYVLFVTTRDATTAQFFTLSKGSVGLDVRQYLPVKISEPMLGLR